MDTPALANHQKFTFISSVQTLGAVKSSAPQTILMWHTNRIFFTDSVNNKHIFFPDQVQRIFIYNIVLQQDKTIISNNIKQYRKICFFIFAYYIYYDNVKLETYHVPTVDDFGLVLWHINHCRLFNAKSSLYIYIKYIRFSLVGFYGISTIVGYLMPNPLYTYILNI